MPWAQQQRVVLVARDHAEVEWSQSTFPRSFAFSSEEHQLKFPVPPHVVNIALCAFGPIHPTTPKPQFDAQCAMRDLQLLHRVFTLFENVPARIVFVSSVVALSPRTERQYYAGWKLALEQSLRELVHARSRCTLAVLYPGRLVDQKSLRHPSSLLHTSYSQAAAQLAKAMQSARPRRLILGLDSRLWLLARSVRTFAAGVLGVP